ncbi:DUF5605 domain-containing protein [Leifsonia sp. NPDC058292]|uniref:DUF5605 domain-containing protein n=1 Tax=Leifsonia sp. NPDC058292 TaxID=3346428 RepID=UPI0036D902CC
MRTFDQYASFGDALDNSEAREVLERSIPDILQSSLATSLRGFPLGGFLRFALAPDEAKIDALLSQLGRIEDKTPRPAEAAPIVPRNDYESEEVVRGSATLMEPASAFVHKTVEIVVAGPEHGNPFVDVELTADFVHPDITLTIGGFYDGDGRYLLRFLPPLPGEWTLSTTSNARSLDGLVGYFSVEESSERGPVRVSEQYAFSYANGAPYSPFGTTSYVWTHQPESLQLETLETLAAAPFNKLRMGLFPKDFLYNSNEPENYVFPTNEDGTFDTERFDTEFFKNLEERIGQLGVLGIEADLILFHPYDRWGFSTLGTAADERYVRYVTRRLAGFANVWWSMANEYDLLLSKRPEDWSRLAEVVQQEDHADHLLSIHNWSDLFDYSVPWATHASIQRGDADMSKRIDEWRHQWGKPVVVDEFGYDGDLDQGWGNLRSEDVVDRFWAGMIRGGYLTHGETFYRDDEVIWWSKGGRLQGESVARIAFLRRLVEESPTGRLDPLASDWDAPWGGVKDQYILIYFGLHRPKFRDVVIPDGMHARIQVVDTWNMTVEDVPGTHSGTTRIQLPARPHMALRLTEA